jgi:hypothetical protein
MNFYDVTELRKWAARASLQELDDRALEFSADAVPHRIISTERERRQFQISSAGDERRFSDAAKLQEKHFKILNRTFKPEFIVAFLAMVFAGISAWPIVLQWMRSPVQVPQGVIASEPQSTPPALVQPKASEPLSASTPIQSGSIPANK